MDKRGFTMIYFKQTACVLVIAVFFTAGCVVNPPRRKISIHIEKSGEPVKKRSIGPPPEPRIVREEGRTVCFYPCRYTYGEEIKRILDDMATAESSVLFSKPLNMVVFSDPERKVVDTMLGYVKLIDVYKPQVLVEAKIVEINVDSDLEFELSSLFEVLNPTRASKFRKAEVTLTTPGTNPSAEGFGATVVHLGSGSTDQEQFTNFLRLLVTEGKAEILSSPNLIVSAGHTASIITGEEVPVTNQTAVSGTIQTNTVFKRVGVKLRVTPMQITHEMVYLEVNPEVSTVIGYTSGETSNPIVAVRNTSTTLRVKDSELIAIGGLLREEDRLLEKRIPVLSAIPILGHLFRSQRHERGKTQLVFFLRIQILPESEKGEFSVPEQGMKNIRLDEKIDSMRKEADEESSGRTGTESGPDRPGAGEPEEAPEQ